MPQQIPGDQSGNAGQHDEGVVVEIAALQTRRAARNVQGRRGDAVGPNAVDQVAVAGLPKTTAEGEGRAYENLVIKLVEVSFLEQKAVDGLEPSGQGRR